ncbi:hypothetical protein M3Y95_01107900 [Aphelenchoides besseyi]|nr:hypothetical protein M3Y95_01107900 [Aphelenchoides besseyi]
MPLTPNCNNNHYRKCLAGIDVHKGTLIFAVFGIVFNFFFSFNGLGSRIPWYFPASALIGVFEIATYVCLLIGNMKHWPQLYLPFLFINGGITLLMVVCVIGFYVIGILLLLDKIHLTAEYNDVYGTLSVVIAAIYTLAAIFQSYVLFVVLRDYQWLKGELPKLEDFDF